MGWDLDKLLKILLLLFYKKEKNVVDKKFILNIFNFIIFVK